MQVITSIGLSVIIDVEPNSVVQTSPARFVDTGKIFNSKYPIASEPVDNIAIAASPFILAFWPMRKSKMAQIAVTGKTSKLWFKSFKIDAIAIAPKAM